MSDIFVSMLFGAMLAGSAVLLLWLMSGNAEYFFGKLFFPHIKRRVKNGEFPDTFCSCCGQRLTVEYKERVGKYDPITGRKKDVSREYQVYCPDCNDYRRMHYPIEVAGSVRKPKVSRLSEDIEPEFDQKPEDVSFRSYRF